MKIFVSTHPFGSVDAEPMALLQRAGLEVECNPYQRKVTREELQRHLADRDGLIAGTETLDKAVLDQAPKLRVIARVGIGVDGIDFEEARRRGILVTYTPEAVTQAVAELTVGLMLSLARGIPVIDASMKRGQWNRLIGEELRGKTLGLVGFGRVGRRVAKLLQGFEMRLLANDIVPDEEAASHLGVKFASKEELYRAADFLSLHVPKTSLTADLINEKTLHEMKPGACLINTARGGVVNENDLFNALWERRIAAAAVDVFNIEPYIAGRLCKLDNVLLTSHSGSCSRQARSMMERGAAEEVARFFRGESPLFPVPLEAMRMEKARKVIPINADWHEVRSSAVARSEDRYSLYRRLWGQYPTHNIVAANPLNLDIELIHNPPNPGCEMLEAYLAAPGAGSRFMDEGLYQAIMKELATFQDPAAVKFGFRGDALHHPLLASFVRQAKRAGCIEAILSTRGRILDDALVQSLIEAGLDSVSLFIEGRNSTPETPGHDIEDILRACETLNRVKLRRVLARSVRPQTRVVTEMELGDTAGIEAYSKFWGHWADAVTVTERWTQGGGADRKAEWACSRPWQRLVITWEGRIVLCNYDLAEEHVLGRFPETSIASAWRSQAMQDMRQAHLENRSGSVRPCAGCPMRRNEIAKLAR